MSIDPEDSVLEQALRQDLPSPDAEARLRRRLLAAGVAIGNGVATTTAAASGGAATSSIVAKAVASSWGVKLGVTAALAIPTLGLWLESRSAPPQPPAAPIVVSARAGEQSVARPLAPPARAPVVETIAEPRELGPERGVPRRERPLSNPTPAAATEATPATHPSERTFAPASEPAPPAPQVASTLADETRLLDSAFAQLAAGNRARAAELISEHEARYPRGLLVRERERAKTRLSELSRGE